ncbi:hypothetical protein OESDEN_21897 [Oesophagostomum dentatum]|uniref:Prolyl 4-hydroxylase N-terminal domain-containing protein n=1 Tax=Oesophagostomum dentatum TaxID=61180 RepID=A0A0B1S4R2_OESDE|nr:hypothetical protein OESDEN_21897 [Oesophagostomum dentatum]
MLGLIALLALLCTWVQADLFTSVADMHVLIDEKKSIPNLLYNFINEEQERLEQLRGVAAQFEQKYVTWADEIKDITNPINAFLLIKKKVNDL